MKTYITTIINHSTVFIMGQSIRADNKIIPRYTHSQAEAKEFDGTEHAKLYLSNVINPAQHRYEIIQVES